MLHPGFKRRLNVRFYLCLIIGQLPIQPLLQQRIGSIAVLPFDRIGKLRQQIHRRLQSGSAQIPFPEGDRPCAHRVHRKRQHCAAAALTDPQMELLKTLC